ncbi:MAG: hemolysin III family protein [Myxococcales bacterium]|nr:hemolysin III family protein [Myxococcales bacterium]
MASRPAPPKPTLRGALHHWAALVSFGAGSVLVGMAPSTRSAWAAFAHSLGMFLLFAISAAYHRPTWNKKARAWMRRLDHAAIFVLIAGSYTGICLLALPPEISQTVLTIVWIGAGAGILQSLLWVHAPKPLTAVLYLILGWSIIPYFSELKAGISLTNLMLLLIGGAAYTAGAVIYAVRRPNPWPRVFGYHEIFHALTIVACGLHFLALLSMVKQSG